MGQNPAPTDMVGPEAVFAFALVAVAGFVVFLACLRSREAKEYRWLGLAMMIMGGVLTWTALTPLPVR